MVPDSEPEEPAPYLPKYWDYWECMYAQCVAACGQGRMWDCAGSYQWPAPEEVEDGIIKYTYRVFDMMNPTKGVEGATVSVCSRADVDCLFPLFTTKTDEQGYCCLDLPVLSTVGFSGYFQIEHDDYLTTRDQFGRPIHGANSVGQDVVRKAAFEVVWDSLGVPVDFERGFVTAIVFDCWWWTAPGIELEIESADAATVPFYYAENGTVALSQTMTSTAGLGGFLNVPVTGEPVAVTARNAATGEIVGCHEVYIRPGVINGITMYPFDTLNFGCPGGVP